MSGNHLSLVLVITAGTVALPLALIWLIQRQIERQIRARTRIRWYGAAATGMSLVGPAMAAWGVAAVKGAQQFEAAFNRLRLLAETPKAESTRLLRALEQDGYIRLIVEPNVTNRTNRCPLCGHVGLNFTPGSYYDEKAWCEQCDWEEWWVSNGFDPAFPPHGSDTWDAWERQEIEHQELIRRGF